MTFKNPLQENTHLKQDMFNELVYFLFRDANIKIILINKPKIQPETNEEITQILILLFLATLVLTYEIIKEIYKWYKMKRTLNILLRVVNIARIIKLIVYQVKPKWI